MKALRLAGAALVAIIVILILIAVVGIPSGFVTSSIRQQIERETGYRLAIDGAIRISFWPTLNVSLSGLTLSDPEGRETSSRITIERAQADMTLSSLWSGRPDISELVITRPVLHSPLLRERLPNSNPPQTPATASASEAVPTIAHVTVKDGRIIFTNARDRVENRVEAIDLEAAIGTDRHIKVAGTARAGEAPLKFDLAAIVPHPPVEHQSVPFEVTIEAPDWLAGPLKARADARLNGSVVMINGVNGTLANGAFNGWASVDGASKPLVTLDLDFQKLDIAMAKRSGGAPSQSWSDAPIDLNGLNYLDAEVRLSANELTIGEARFAQAAIDSRLSGGVVKMAVANLGAYGGKITGEAVVDATSGTPSFSMHSDLAGVRALPLLTSLADFNWLDGRLQAKLNLRSTGNSQRQIMSNLAGTAFTDFRDGSIRGINVAKMVRELTTSTLSGWQESRDQGTDLTQLSASFRLDKGQAATTDLYLVGPLVRMTGSGTVDLGTKTLAFRVEPKLVPTTQGQGRTNEPVGLGIPVVIDGPWVQPRIYPDMAGMLDNPDAAYAKLREMGKGLFGGGGGIGDLLKGFGGGNKPSGGTSEGKSDQDSLGESIGNLIQQGLQQGFKPGGSRGIPPPAPGTTQPAPQQQDPSPPPQESQPMNDVLRQLFNR